MRFEHVSPVFRLISDPGLGNIDKRSQQISDPKETQGKTIDFLND